MKVGFIGLGIMGRPMAKNLIRKGYSLVVNTRKKETLDEFRSLGAEVALSGREVAEKCPVIITMLPNSPQVREVALGKDGIADGAHGDLTLIDMSSIDPVETKAIAAELGKKGIGMLDCPVSGGEPKAIDGTLSVMAGGDRTLFERYSELLSAMASSVVHVGDIGSGNIAKLANQIIVACNIAAMSEALAFAKKAGADPARVYSAIRGGLAGSAVLDAKAPMILDRNFRPGFRVELHIKDLTNALNAAHAVSSPVPLTGEVMEMMQTLRAMGLETEDHSALVRYYELISGVTVE